MKCRMFCLKLKSGRDRSQLLFPFILNPNLLRERERRREGRDRERERARERERGRERGRERDC